MARWYLNGAPFDGTISEAMTELQAAADASGDVVYLDDEHGTRGAAWPKRERVLPEYVAYHSWRAPTW